MSAEAASEQPGNGNDKSNDKKITVGGHFLLCKKIGNGSFGNVYLGLFLCLFLFLFP